MQVALIDFMGDDLTVVNAARVSFSKESEWDVVEGSKYSGPLDEVRLKPADEKLVRYLTRHKHMSPFGHCFVSFHIKAPVFVARQLVKHKFLRMNEVSRRYVDEEPEFYKPEEWRGRSADKKQGSEGVVEVPEWDTKTFYNSALQCYKFLLAKGVAPEQARMVLPQSMMTEWYWSGSLDAFTDMCNLRCKEDTQWETRQVANKIRDVLLELFPVSASALME